MAVIVIITTKGAVKRSFVNTLQKETGGMVKLVILQNIRRKNIFKRIQIFYKKVGFPGIIPEIYYFLVVKLSPKKKRALSILSLRSRISESEKNYLAETVETDNVDDDAIYEYIKDIKPDMIVIWGGYILKPRILETARYAVNIHFGFTPYYRGVNGIEHAILNNDFKHIGVTIHYAIPKVDAGEVIKVVSIDHRTRPEEFFKVLNDLAFKEYIVIIKSLLEKGRISSSPQDLALGRNYLLKEWTYKKQNTLANKIIDWQKKYGS